VRTVRLVLPALLALVALAACGSTSSASNSTSTTSRSAESIVTVWPSVRASYGAVSSSLLRVGNDVVGFASTNGAGPTTHLESDLRTLTAALSTTAQTARNAMTRLSPHTAGYEQLSKFQHALQSASQASVQAETECQGSAGNACLNAIHAVNAHVKTSNNAGAFLNSLAKT
jgi:hypothetical protein